MIAVLGAVYIDIYLYIRLRGTSDLHLNLHTFI